jgi:hypothetical protein
MVRAKSATATRRSRRAVDVVSSVIGPARSR